MITVIKYQVPNRPTENYIKKKILLFGFTIFVVKHKTSTFDLEID